MRPNDPTKMPLELFQTLISERFAKHDASNDYHALTYTFIRREDSLSILVRSITTEDRLQCYRSLVKLFDVPPPPLDVDPVDLLEGIDELWDILRLQAALKALQNARDEDEKKEIL